MVRIKKLLLLAVIKQSGGVCAQSCHLFEPGMMWFQLGMLWDANILAILHTRISRPMLFLMDFFTSCARRGVTATIEVKAPEQVDETWVRAEVVEERVNFDREYQSRALFISLL